MSALFSTPQEASRDVDDPHEDDTDATAVTPVVVRRRAGLVALIGAAASAVAIAYLWRASQTMATLDWSLCAVMALVACYYLASLIDARTPLAVADNLGVRIRLGQEWRVLSWEAIRQVTVHPRRGVLREGRIAFAPHSIARVIDGLEGRARRHAVLNEKMFGAVLAVPVGVTTRVSTGRDRSLVDQIAALALGRAEVIEVAASPVEPTEPTEPVETAEPTEPVEPTDPVTGAEPDAAPSLEAATSPDEGPRAPRPARRRRLGGIATIASRVGKTRHRDRDRGRDDEAEGAPPDPTTHADPAPGADEGADEGGGEVDVVPMRETRRALRAEVTRDVLATTGNAVPAEAYDGEQFGPDTSSRVRPISKLGDPVEPLVMADFATEPAYHPVIGPDLTAARTRLGLSVDELADRTRIRPHVIESIEVDDFAPCGGDFYARGHLRTLARVLGKDPLPFLSTFEDRYATAPVNARRVFEAELATGMRGSMRSTIGGPNWGLLVGVVLGLILVWGVVRFFSAEPAELVQNPAPVLNGSAGLGSDPKPGSTRPAAKPMPLTLVAAHGGSQLVVRNANGRIVFSGQLLLGQKKRLTVLPPARVRAGDAGAIEVSVRGRDQGVLGVLGERGSRTLR